MNRRFSLLLLFGPTLFGQHILYNEARDKTARDTLEAAKQIASKPLSEAELRNLGVIEQNQLKSAIEWYRVTMRSNIQAFRKWSDVREAIDAIRQELDEREKQLAAVRRDGSTQITVASLTARAGAAKAAAENAIHQAAAPAEARKKESGQTSTTTRNEEEKAVPPSVELKALGERVGQFSELLGLAGKLTTTLQQVAPAGNQEALADLTAKQNAAQDALADIQKGIQEVQELAATIESIITSWRGVKVDPASLAPSPEKIALELLERESEYIKTLTALRVRRYMEVAEVRALLRRFNTEFLRCGFTGAELDSLITDDLTRFMGNEGLRDALEGRLTTLLLAARLTARQSGDQTMNDVRESIEYRRYRVSLNKVYNGSYETALQAAASRLAAYYASGLRPTQVAQFVYQLGTAVALPYVAVTK
ncbi:MAG: hypothetical protein QM757_06415 [Paludibaculum sp.]